MSRVDNIKSVQKEILETGHVMYFSFLNKDTLNYIIDACKALTGSQSIIMLLPTNFKGDLLPMVEFSREIGDIDFISVEDEFMCDIYSDGHFMYNNSEFFYEFVEGIENGLVITDGESTRSSILMIKSNE